MTIHVIPPVVEVQVTNSIDIMRVGDAARRVANIQGFSPIYQAMAAGACMSLAEWLCRTKIEHKIQIYGMQVNDEICFRLDCTLNWLNEIDTKKFEDAMLAKLSGLVDEVKLTSEPESVLYLTLWLKDERRAERVET